jgi:hypothetical protein
MQTDALLYPLLGNQASTISFIYHLYRIALRFVCTVVSVLVRRLEDGEQGAEHYVADFLRLEFLPHTRQRQGRRPWGRAPFPQSENNRIVL